MNPHVIRAVLQTAAHDIQIVSESKNAGVRHQAEARARALLTMAIEVLDSEKQQARSGQKGMK